MRDNNKGNMIAYNEGLSEFEDGLEFNEGEEE